MDWTRARLLGDNCTDTLDDGVSKLSTFCGSSSIHSTTGPGPYESGVRPTVTTADGNLGNPDPTQFLNMVTDPVVLTNLGLQVVAVNRGTTQRLGYTLEALTGNPVDRVIPERQRPRLRQLVSGLSARTQDDDESVEIEIPVLTSGGQEIATELCVTRVDAFGEPCLTFTFRDITHHRRVENELRTSQLLLAEAQRVARIGSWRWDVEADTINWSAELHRIFGVPEDHDHLSYPDFLNLIHPADRDRIHQTIQESREQGSSFSFEHRILRPDGVVRLVYGQGAAQLDEDGKLISMIGTAQDVTEYKANEAQAFQLALEQAARQEAERTKERFQFLAEVSEALGSSLEYEATLDRLMRLLIPRMADWCSMNTITPNGTINRLAVAHRDPDKQRILESIRAQGFLPDGDESHPLTRALYEGVPELYAEVTDEMLQKMSRGPEHLELARQLNTTSIMIVPLIARGRAFGAVTFATSESGRRYTEDDLQLAIEVAHRAAVSIDNAHLYAEAQDAARAREEFVSLVSHELKTPLTVIKGYMQVMERYLERPDWERERILTTKERLSTQVGRLELLVADILDVSRIQRGRLELNVQPDTDVAELARHVMERFDDAIERQPGHALRFTASGPVVGCWDPLRLDQVFSNLLSNALKYSPDGGTIDLAVRQDGDEALIEVSDHGVGISVEEQNRLFQPFQRGAAAARGISGTGLGLYITRQIIEQHGGRIMVESEPGKSTTFRVRLPLKPAPLFGEVPGSLR